MLWLGAIAPIALSACGGEPPRDDEIARGRALFASRSLSPSGLNAFTCATCHAERPGTGPALLPGAALAGVTRRPSFWGGQEGELLRAIDACRSAFMRASTPLSPGNADADALYVYLESLEPGAPEPVPFTVVESIENVPRGSASAGAATFAAACAPCHGSMHTGERRLLESIPILPEDTLSAHPAPTYSARVQRLVFIEKTRHGGFLGYGGQMPPFSLEVLPNAALSDLLEGLGVLGE